MKMENIVGTVGISVIFAVAIVGGISVFGTHYTIHQDLEKNSDANVLRTYVEKSTPDNRSYVYGSNTYSLDSATKVSEFKKAAEFIKESKAFDEK